MAGHSKWANIQHRKKAQDAKRGKLFTRLIKEITIASRLGGTDAAANPRLRLAVDKAQAANMNKDVVERAIKRGAGLLEGQQYESVRYEGYGAAGSAVLVECLTDNRNRTVAEVRSVFTRYGGNLGENGSVAYLFTQRGVLVYEQADEDAVLEAALEAGADDVIGGEAGLGVGVQVFTAPQRLAEVKEAMEVANLPPDEFEVTMLADPQIELDADNGEKVVRLLDALEELDDVQDVYCNVDLSAANDEA